MKHSSFLLALVPLFAAGGCGTGQSNDPGLDALLRVAGAQFHLGERPQADDGPAVRTLDAPSLLIYPGMPSRSLSGRAQGDTVAVSFGVEGDSGYWVVPASSPDAMTKDITYAATLSFSQDVPPGDLEVVVRAVDDAAHFGPAATVDFQVIDAEPTGAMVVSLSWDTNADLDLHVVQPDGVEIWSKNINAYVRPPLGESQPPDDVVLAEGILDFDSNAGCVIDGRRRENVVWRDAPPAGHYLVRVDAFSMCGQAASPWVVRVQRDGEEVASAEGVATAGDTRFAHEAGSGLLAVEFDVP